MAIYRLPQDRVISHLIRRIVMYVLTDEEITQRDTLLLLQRDSLVPCVRFSDIYCDVIIMFRIVHSNKLEMKK